MVVRSRLEFEGIECFVKDELTIQVDNFYSNAIGGLELQVKTEDVENALFVLKEMGLVQNDIKPRKKSHLIKLTDRIPILNRWPLSLRILILLPLILGPLIFFIQIKTQRSTSSLLLRTNWCVNTIEYNGSTIANNTIPESTIYSPYQPCETQMRIDDDYHIFIPTEGHKQIMGHILIRNDSVEIFGLDTLQKMYHHVFKVDATDSRLVLTSKTTKLWCTITMRHLWL